MVEQILTNVINVIIIIDKKINSLKNKNMAKFKVGSTYEMRFIGDSNLKPKFTCIKRTEKTATFKRYERTETFTKKIKTSDDGEYVLYGNYSMSPIIRAKNIVRFKTATKTARKATATRTATKKAKSKPTGETGVLKYSKRLGDGKYEYKYVKKR
jgi:hypothetical protein